MSGTREKERAGGRRQRREAAAGRRRRGKKTAGIVLCCLAAVAIGAVWAWNHFVRAPDVSALPERPGIQGQTASPGDTPVGEEPGVAAGRKPDYFTFLLIGRDTGGGGNTDTLILVSYDVPNGQVNMMSIPRDTLVNVPWSVKKINSVYNAKESRGGGIEGLKTQVGYLTGVVPDFYAIIEWDAVGELVEAVGGIEFDVPRDMDYDDPYQDLHIHLKKGLQKLNGQQAMEMLRYRHDNNAKVGYNDTGRAETQREFLKAMAKKVVQIQNMTKIGSFIQIFMDNVETDLTLSNLMWFASKALTADLDGIQSLPLPCTDLGKFRGAYYFAANPQEIVPLVNQYFNPYQQDVTQEDLQVVLRNQDGSCYVTNGELLDSRWASPVSGGSSAGSKVPAPEPEPAPEPTAPETPEGTAPEVPEDGETEQPPADGGSEDPDGGTEPAGPDAGGGTADPGTGSEEPEGGEGEEPTLPPEPTLPELDSGSTAQEG